MTGKVKEKDIKCNTNYRRYLCNVLVFEKIKYSPDESDKDTKIEHGCRIFRHYLSMKQLLWMLKEKK